MHAVKPLPLKFKKPTVKKTNKTNKKNNRRSIRLIEHFVQPTENQLKAIADLIAALVVKSCSVPAVGNAQNSASANQEVNS